MNEDKKFRPHDFVRIPGEDVWRCGVVRRQYSENGETRVLVDWYRPNWADETGDETILRFWGCNSCALDELEHREPFTPQRFMVIEG